LLSVVGNDRDGMALADLLRGYGVEPVFLLDPTLPTTVKLRVVTRGYQVVRADFEGRPDHELLLPLVDRLCESARSADAIIFSDYGKGGLAHIQRMIDCARKARRPVLVDPKGTDYSAYRGATTITPNREEFALVAGRWHDEADFERRAFALRDTLELGSLLVTRSEEGMSLFLGEKHIRIPTQAREVFDVSGAGDTVISAMATAMAAGFDVESAARLANVAAGIVVGKAGTTPITLAELQAHV
jgi:rfaE bifunctional protein kinase chain/domain